MASLQELRKRLKSIRTTGQLAAAMRTAATAKYARLGKLRADFTPYAEACRDMLAQLGGSGVPHPEDAEMPGRDCVIVLGGNRGMCGGFNAELTRFLDAELQKFDDPIVLVCGRKPAAHLRERGVTAEEFSVSDVPAYDEIKSAADRLLSLYGAGEAGRVFAVWQRFGNMLTQIPTARRLLPEEDEARETGTDAPLLYLPDRETIGAQLAISCFEAQLFGLAVECALGAQAATLMAMRSACDNADEAAADLEVRINRRRQAEVTSGVIETASGNIHTDT